MSQMLMVIKTRVAVLRLHAGNSPWPVLAAEPCRGGSGEELVGLA